MEARLLYITAPSQEEALRLGRHLLERRLCACVNIVPAIISLYWWDGAIQQDGETLLLAKTTVSRVQACIDAVRERHSYEVPCVVSLPIEAGNPAFLRWIEEETTPPLLA